MSVPIYQTVSDLDMQESIRLRLERARRSSLVAFGPLSACDYVAVRDGRAVCMVEVRTRNIRFGTFDTFKVELDKVQSVARLAQALNVPKAGLVLRFIEGALYWLDVNQPYGVGELNRRDKQDHTGTGHAAAAVFPWSAFRWINDTGPIHDMREFLSLSQLESAEWA